MTDGEKSKKNKFLPYLLISISIFIGLSLLPFTAGWLKFQHYFPIILILGGSISFLLYKYHRQTSTTEISEQDKERFLRLRELITEGVFKRIRWLAVLISVVAFFGGPAFIQYTFKDKIRKIENAEIVLDKIDNEFNNLQIIKMEIDTLYQEVKGSVPEIENTKTFIADQADYIKKRINIVDSVFTLVSTEKVALMKKLLKEGRDIDQEFNEKRENQYYKISIHYTNENNTIAEEISSILKQKGFWIELDKRSITEYKNIIFFYTSEDLKKAKYIIEQLKKYKIIEKCYLDQQRSKQFDIWL